MSYRLKAYSSVAELLGSVSTEIEQTRRQLRRVLEAAIDIRKRSERAKRLQQVFLNGTTPPGPTPSKGVRIGDLDIVVNAGVDDELLALELMARTQNERIIALQKIQASLSKLQSKGQPDALKEISCIVIENDGVPRKLMFQDRSHFESAAMSSLFPSTTHGPNAGVDHGSLPGESKMGDVQLEMTSIIRESNGRDHIDDSDHAGNGDAVSEAAHVSSDGRLSNVLRFVTAKP